MCDLFLQLKFNAHFSHVHTTFWQCSNRRRNLVPDESGAKYACHVYQKPGTENGISLQCWFLESVSWVLRTSVVGQLLNKMCTSALV